MEKVCKSKVTLVESIDPSKPSPIIASFQSNDIKQLDQVICKRIQTTEDRKKFALISTESNVYKAQIDDTDNDLQDTYVLLHDRSTGECKMVQVQQASFKHVLYDNSRSIFEQNNLDSRKILNKEFGGKRAAVSFDRQARTRMNKGVLENSVNESLLLVDSEKFEGENESFSEAHEENIFPPIENANSSDIKSVFTIKNLIGESLLEHLMEIAMDVLQTDPKELPLKNKYLLEHIKAIQTSKKPESTENLQLTAMVIYAETINQLIISNMRVIDKMEICKFSNQLRNDVVEKFVKKDTNAVSAYTKQKSIIYFIILNLLISKTSKASISELIETTNLSNKDLMKYAQLIGCRKKGDSIVFNRLENVGKDAKIHVPILKAKKRGGKH
jgi:hypothetical protein